ncbi:MULTISPECIES: hypothetical protein [unclassified Nonomuraea]|uniref:hypothetical protein n=1 Tax=unclassified Nonomuraea TaxID=2593643 RepID=UPI0033F14153
MTVTIRFDRQPTSRIQMALRSQTPRGHQDPPRLTVREDKTSPRRGSGDTHTRQLEKAVISGRLPEARLRESATFLIRTIARLKTARAQAR